MGLALAGEGLNDAIKAELNGEYELKVPKGYIYFAMAFSFIVEIVNIKMRKKGSAPIKLHKEIKE